MTAAEVFLLKSGGRYARLHRPGCPTIKTMAGPPKPLTRSEAEQRRCRRCRTCCPDLPEKRER